MQGADDETSLLRPEAHATVAVTVEFRGAGDAKLRAVVREDFPLLVRELAVLVQDPGGSARRARPADGRTGGALD